MLQVELQGWEAMVYIEPKLKDIVVWYGASDDQAALAYEAGKSEARLLVGWDANDERLRSSDCYEIFIRKLAEAVGL